jgi:hypothetical protein
MISTQVTPLVLARPNRHGRQEIPFRDVEWLSALCCDKTADPDRSALAHELSELAVERFCEPRPPRPAYYSPHDRRETSVSETSLLLLLKGLVACGRDEDLSHVIHFVQASPDEFSLDDCQVPCLKSLIPWSQKQSGSVRPQLVSWLIAVRQQLESATARQPVPPTDWARPAEVACKCQYCAQLKAFLADPANEVGRIPAREDMRQHLIGIIAGHQCDVNMHWSARAAPIHWCSRRPAAHLNGPSSASRRTADC